VDGTTQTYDSRGNLTTGYNVSFDCENRLVTAESISFAYDLLGRRIKWSLGMMASIVYVWDGDQIIAEYTYGSLTTKYIYGPGMDNPVAMIDVNPSTQAETWYYYYADALGSIRLMTDAGGYPVESYTYDVYGTPYVMTSAGADNNWLTEDVTTQNYSSIGNPYLFTGRRWYSSINLYYYRFRDYSPELGRFLQTDPAGYVDTLNLYAYCGNNSVNWIDPWGLDKTPGLIGAGVALIGGFTICLGPTAPVVWVGVGLVAASPLVQIGEAYMSSASPPAVHTPNGRGDTFGEEYQYYEDHPEDMLDDIVFGLP